MYYVASSLASRDGTHAHCSMNIKCGVYWRAATIRSAAFIRGNTVVVGVEYYNYLFDSGHQESSQSFTMKVSLNS